LWRYKLNEVCDKKIEEKKRKEKKNKITRKVKKNLDLNFVSLTSIGCLD